MTTKLLDRKGLLLKEIVKVEKVDLGNDEIVYVREMSGREKDTFEQSLVKEIKNEKGEVTGYDRSLIDFRAKLAVVTLCDEQGNSLLQASDYEILSQNMRARKLEKIVDAAQKLNAITEVEKENIVKNLDGDQVANSNSNSASV